MLPEKLSGTNAARKKALEQLEHTKGMLQIALFGLERYQLSIANHWSFYAISGAMRACLMSELKSCPSRDDTFREFRRDFLRSGLLPLDLEPKILSAMELHFGLDEEDYYLITIEQMHTAMDLIRHVEGYLLA